MTAGLVHIVDDDPAIRDALGFLLRSRGVRSTAWDDGAAFLAGGPLPDVACVILDVRMDGLSGLEVFDILRQRGIELPVIFLTGHADVPLAVEALKKGAFDFVEKPFNDNQLVDTVIAALERAAAARRHNRDRDLLTARMASLTPREREVLQCLVEGRLNKQIADQLGVSMRTVEVHRSRVFEKMGVRNAVELVAQVGPLALEI